MSKINALVDEIKAALDELMELVNETPPAGEEVKAARYVQHIHTGEWLHDGLITVGPVVWSRKQNRTRYSRPFDELKKILLAKGYVVGQDVRIMRSKR